MPTGLTLFSGAGVADYGLQQAGFKLVGAVERDDKAAEIYRRNFGEHVINDDVFNVDYRQFEGVDLVHASPPCQAYSQARSRNLPDHKDKDAGLALIDAVKQINPRYVTLENVPGYAKSMIWQSIRNELWAMGYWINERVINCADYGVPQNRKRLFMIACRGTIPAIPEPGELRVSWWNAIADLVNDLPETKFPPYLKERINRLGYDADNLEVCLIRRYSRSLECFNPIPASAPAPTILAQGGDGHWRQLDMVDDDGVIRRVTPRCAARLMTLPDEFWLPDTKWVAWKAMGNGFPALAMRRMVEGLVDRN